jgi:hypothetical protein
MPINWRDLRAQLGLDEDAIAKIRLVLDAEVDEQRRREAKPPGTYRVGEIEFSFFAGVAVRAAQGRLIGSDGKAHPATCPICETDSDGARFEHYFENDGLCAVTFDCEHRIVPIYARGDRSDEF